MSQELAPQGAEGVCPDNTVCLYTGRNFTGGEWQWSPGNGYRDLPSSHHDSVGSFIANAACVFIDHDPKERRAVNDGDFRRVYDNDFGGRIDAIDR